MTPVSVHMRRPSRVPVAALAATIAVLLVGFLAAPPSLAGVGAAPAGAQPVGEPRYRPPVDAPVIDPFRPPAVPWGPGNRGLEYGTAAGTPVRAIGPGVVSFAGPVAGTLHVTVTHPDGLRSSYSGVAAVRVSVGQVVDGGQVVAVSAATLHLGVREGDRYIDPAGLWGLEVASGPVVLVPVQERPGVAVFEPPAHRIARAAVLRALARVRLGPWVG